MDVTVSSNTLTLYDGEDSFDVLNIGAAHGTHTVLFAAGRGGDPARHQAMLHSLAKRGCNVIAPRLAMLASPFPTQDELLTRSRRLAQAASSLIPEGSTLAGVGHSIGATILLGLAGGEIWTLAGKLPSLSARLDFVRLVLLTPATDFFRTPGALETVATEILAWAGTEDAITPPRQVAFLEETLPPSAPITTRLAENAGHFSFMHDLPPHIEDTHPDRATFLANLTDEVGEFVLQ